MIRVRVQFRSPAFIYVTVTSKSRGGHHDSPHDTGGSRRGRCHRASDGLSLALSVPARGTGPAGGGRGRHGAATAGPAAGGGGVTDDSELSSS